MRKGLLAAGFAAVSIVTGSAVASAHGGNYRGGQYDGPGDATPPNDPGGGDTTPPGNPGGPSTPGPGTPNTGRPRGPATSGPSAPPTGGGGGIRGGSGGMTKRGGSEGYERWEFWWEHNKEPFLQLKARLGKSAITSGASRFSSRRHGGDLLPATRPGPGEIERDIVPPLLEGLLESHPDVVDSAALALGRSVRPDEGSAKVFEALRQALGHKEKSAREAATLALGVLGNPAAVAPLTALLDDTAEGRRLTAHPEGVEPLVRAFAAAALGLLHATAARGDLERAVGESGTANLGVKGMAVLALGMLGEEPADPEELVRFLLALMQDRAANPLVRAQAPIALGRLARSGTAGAAAVHAVLGPRLLRQFQDESSDIHLRRSLAIALGMVATAEDADVLDALIGTVAAQKDDSTRHFSIIAIAQIGARDAEPAKHPEVHAKLAAFFEHELAEPHRITHQPYAALGSAIYARNEKLADGRKAAVAHEVQAAFDATTNPSYSGAMAVALGLLDAKEASDDLWKRYEESNDAPLKGYIAVGLGLMRVTTHAAEMREEIQKKGLHPRYRLQLARALGLMGDVDALPALIRYLESSETLAETASAAQAVGLVGDRSAVRPLLEILGNRSKQPLQRGFAEIALGILAEKSALPWNVAFAVDANYRAKVDALSEILDLL